MGKEIFHSSFNSPDRIMPLIPSTHLCSQEFKVCDFPTHMKLEPAEGELAVAGIVLDGGDTILVELDFFADGRHVGVYIDKARRK